MSMSDVFGAPAWGLNAGHLSKHGSCSSSSSSPFGSHYNSMTSTKQVANVDLFGGGGGSKTAWNIGGDKDKNNNSKNRNGDFGGGVAAPTTVGGGGGAPAPAPAPSNPWGDVFKSRQNFNEMHFC